MHLRMRKLVKWGLPTILTIVLIVLLWSRFAPVADLSEGDSGMPPGVTGESNPSLDATVTSPITTLREGETAMNDDTEPQGARIAETGPAHNSPASTVDVPVETGNPEVTESPGIGPLPDQVVSVLATAETNPMPAGGDVADDPAVWVHPTNRALSTVIVTNKSDNGGLHVYNLDGTEIQFLQAGRLNNVDIRYGFPLDGEQVALVTASNRTDDTIAIYKVNPSTRQLENVAGSTIDAGIVVYGSCMYVSPDTGKYYTFVNSGDGEVEQWELSDNGSGLVEGSIVRSFDVGTQTEGCVADDELSDFYIGEEDVAIWKYGAEPGDGTSRSQVDAAGAGHLVADIEGLTIYETDSGSGYLIASSQGSNEYVIYAREGNNDYVGKFRIVPGNGVDGTTQTDGIDVVSVGLGSAFPKGLFVAQDDNDNEVPEASKRQNVKLVPWESIANGFSPPLAIAPATAPTITSTPVTSAVKGQLYSYDVEADGSPAPTYTLSTAPAGMTIDPVSGLINWTPAAADTFGVAAEANNAAGTDSQSFTIDVASSLFTDITEASGAGGPSSFGGHGVQFADVTGDGLSDFYVTMNFDQSMAELFYRNVNGATFVEEAALRGIDDFDSGSHGGVWADLDNDGDYDLFNGSYERNRLYLNDGTGFFSDVTVSAGILDVQWGTRGVIAFDMDNDGDLDLFGVTGTSGTSDPTQRNEVYRNDGNMTFTPITTGTLYTAPVGQGATDSDFDGDGDMDIFGANRDGPVNILRNDGTGNFELVSPTSLGISHGAGDGITLADVNNDGHLDILLQKTLYVNDGDNTYTFRNTFSAPGYMGNFEDLDNDGDWDLVFPGDDKVYFNDGAGNFSASNSFSTTKNDPRSVAFADIDEDGDMDFVYGQKRTYNRLIRNDYPGNNNWLKVRLERASGQSGAYGARVYIYEAGQLGNDAALITWREARSQEGYLGQNDPILHFGVGTHSTVDVRAVFLGGLTVDQANISVLQTIAITESGAPAIVSTPVTSAAVGQPYSYDVDAIGNPAPTYSLATAPAGMTIDPVSGLIAWTPATGGDFGVTVEASNANGTDSQSFTITVSQETAPVITSTPVTAGAVGQPYNYDVDASGNPAPTYSLATAPGGMTIDPAIGLINWTPAVENTIDVTVEASNTEGTDSQSFSINVVDPLEQQPVAYLPIVVGGRQTSSAIPKQSDWKDVGSILKAGPPGSWDARLYGQISPCSFLKKDGVYYLYYIGADGNRSTDGGPRHRALGVATSTDGVNFVKYKGNPILTYSPHNNEEEGVTACATAFDKNGDIVLYYGATHAQNPTTTSVDIHIRMRHSVDGFNFVGDTLILEERGDEFKPLGAYRTNAGWYVYYMGPLQGGAGPLRLMYGPTKDNLPNRMEVLAGGFNGMGDPVWLNSTQFALFLQVKEPGKRTIDVRTASSNSPAKLSNVVRHYEFADWGDGTVFFDRDLGKWFMYYKLIDGNEFYLKVS